MPSANYGGDADSTGAMLRPLDADERAAVLDGLFARLDTAGTASETEDAPHAAHDDNGASRGRGRVLALVAATLAIAAALVLWIGLPRPSGAELPGYSMTVLHGGVSEVRSDPRATDRALVVHRGSSVEIVVTPDRATPTAVSVWLIAHGGGAPVMARVADAAVAPTGAVKLRGALDGWLPLAPGEWTIDVVITPADHVLTDAAAASQDPALRRVSFRVTLLPDEWGSAGGGSGSR